MLEYNWPGNIRELENAIERAVALSRGIILTVKDLPTLIAQGEPQITITEKSPTTIEGIVKDAEKEPRKRNTSYVSYVKPAERRMKPLRY